MNSKAYIASDFFSSVSCMLWRVLSRFVSLNCFIRRMISDWMYFDISSLTSSLALLISISIGDVVNPVTTASLRPDTRTFAPFLVHFERTSKRPYLSRPVARHSSIPSMTMRRPGTAVISGRMTFPVSSESVTISPRLDSASHRRIVTARSVFLRDSFCASYIVFIAFSTSAGTLLLRSSRDRSCFVKLSKTNRALVSCFRRESKKKWTTGMDSGVLSLHHSTTVDLTIVRVSEMLKERATHAIVVLPDPTTSDVRTEHTGTISMFPYLYREATSWSRLPLTTNAPHAE